MDDKYQPQELEGQIYQLWEAKNCFQSQEESNRPPFSVIMPPPNVTGSLHLGHALDHTLQDVLVRWHRMRGFNTLWIPGTDHAGIATQAVVEKDLKKKGEPGRVDLGREAFLEKVWDWKRQYGSRIYLQMKKLGDSCDWTREVFTLDPGVSDAVRKTFVDLYKKGLIYRGRRLVNWSPALRTAISDIEVEYREVKGALYKIKYVLNGSQNEHLVVATTRPETLFGDDAICVHPEDERYKSYIGKEVKLPLTDRVLTVLADDSVDPEFGTGVLKITPGHDFNDYEVGVRKGLVFRNIMNLDGSLNEEVPVEFRGLKGKAAREKVVEALTAAGLLIEAEPYTHSVGHCSRSGCVVEPLLSEQWFLKMKELSAPARHVVENGTVRFEPESWTKTYLHWMSIIQDWCISRQLWWGHRIPAWYADDGEVYVTLGDPKTERPDKPWRQDEDVLDTWFSSALWPFTTMGWPKETKLRNTFYPTSVLVTGHDIIFFWVSRMIMMGIESTGDVPFRTVLVHGLIRDAQGRKMSKSDGNAVDPLDLIEKYGADSLRFTLLAQVASGKDLKFSENRLEGYRNFMNKIWNATRFVFQNLSSKSLKGDLDYFERSEGVECPSFLKSELSLYEKWIFHRLQKTMESVHQALAQYRFSDAAQSLYAFVWNDFCDWYLELTKISFRSGSDLEKRSKEVYLVLLLNRFLKLLHPMVPFVTEALYQRLPKSALDAEVLATASFPTLQNQSHWLQDFADTRRSEDFEFLRDVVVAIRNVRGENRISQGVLIPVYLIPVDDQTQKLIGENKDMIQALAQVERVDIVTDCKKSKSATLQVSNGDKSALLVVPLEGLVDFEEEMARVKRSIEKLSKEESQLSGRLASAQFRSGAPKEIVDAAELQLAETRKSLEVLKEALVRLSMD